MLAPAQRLSELETIDQIERHGLIVVEGTNDVMFGGRFRGRQPESVSINDWAHMPSEIRDEA